MVASAQEVLAFWLDELKPSDWYRIDEDLDQSIRDRFSSTWQEARDGGLGLWLTCASETLAYIIVTDQFARNMFRGDPRSFELDQQAKAAAKMAIHKGWDTRIDEPARQFFYLPLMHAENLCDQDRAVRLIHTRMPETGAQNIDHARAHREIIRRFGRFPYRNVALGRADTPAEAEFLANSGYGEVLRTVQAELAEAS